MSPVATYAAIGLGLLVLAALGYGTLTMCQRIRQNGGRLRLHSMMQRYGASLPRAVADSSYPATLAVRRCVACSQAVRCDAWLASGKRAGAERFCPNATFVRAAASR